MRPFMAMLAAIWGVCALVGCETSNNQYDGVSRFAGSHGPYYDPGSAPREAPAPPLPDKPPGVPEETGNI
jgi:hypothetical protein